MRIDLFTKRKEDVNLSVHQWLAISVCFSCVLVCVRIVATGQFTYLFLVWNLFLAVIPYLTTEFLISKPCLFTNKWKMAALLFLWLLFIPNTFYIVTDLFHLDQFDNAPRWFDLALIFSFAWNGLMMGVLSIRRIEQVQLLVFQKELSFFFLSIIMWLNALGVYVGRYLRFNSWDVFTQPFSLFAEMSKVLFHPFQNKMDWSMISVWSLFMLLLYVTIKKLGETHILEENR
jgi:uncharacterized membrane protein